jgi:TP901 family phage tail tape measure protein
VSFTGDLKISLVLMLKSLLGRGVSQARGELRGLKSEAQGLGAIKGPNVAGIAAYGRSAREASSALRQLKREQAVLGAGVAGGNTILAGTGRAALALGGLYGIRQATRATVGQAISFEKAMAQVRKKVDAPDEAGFQKLEGTINQIAKDYGLARAQVAELTAEAGASGIAFQDLERFMRMTAKAAVAWDMSPGEASQKLAEIKTATQMTIGELEKLAEKINGLGDNSAAKERDIVEMFGRAGAAAKAAGVSFDVSLAALTAVRSTGLQPEVASRWFSAFTGGLRTIEEGSKKAKEGLQILGLDAATVAKGMKTDSLGTMLDIFDRLQKSPEAATAAIKIFGKEWWDETSRAAQALPELRRQLEFLKSGKWEGSLNKTLNIELATTENHLKRMSALTSEIGDRMGRWALPPINNAIDGLLKKFDELKERMEQREKAKDPNAPTAEKYMKKHAADREARGGGWDDWLGEFLFGKKLTKDRSRATSSALLGSATDADALVRKLTDEAAVLRTQAENAKSKEDRARLTIEAGRKEADAIANADSAAKDRRAAGQAAGRDMTNVEGGLQQLPRRARSEESKEAESIRARIAEIENLRARTSTNPFASKEKRAASAAKSADLEAELNRLQARLKELEAAAATTGSAIKDKLTMDLSAEGNSAAASFGSGFAAGAGTAIAAAQSLAATLRATVSTPAGPSPATGGRPATGGSAGGKVGAPTVQVGGITIHGAGDPERAARLVEKRIASAVRSGLAGAHHDGVS